MTAYVVIGQCLACHDSRDTLSVVGRTRRPNDSFVEEEIRLECLKCRDRTDIKTKVTYGAVVYESFSDEIRVDGAAVYEAYARNKMPHLREGELPKRTTPQLAVTEKAQLHVPCVRCDASEKPLDLVKLPVVALEHSWAVICSKCEDKTIVQMTEVECLDICQRDTSKAALLYRIIGKYRESAPSIRKQRQEEATW